VVPAVAVAARQEAGSSAIAGSRTAFTA
jgi:hypothetical protein